MNEIIKLTIDGKEISVPKGTTVYNAAKQLNIELPIFCYQDRMPPFGACRVCMVEVEKMHKPQTSCTLIATEGMVVKTQSKMAIESRDQILEFLLINHPLDCPICDRGGECPLQDQTLKYGPGLSRFFEEKRHFKKPYALGPVLMLDRERCISCARCTRFADIVAGDHALEFMDRGYRTEVGTPDGKPAKSKFIGNTIMICPVGALTSQVYRFRARPWDNDQTKSTCTLCPVGCSLSLDSRDGEIMRTRTCENRDVNDIWLCDKGWFGYEFTSHQDRLQTPLIRRSGKLEPATWDEALSLVAKKINEAKSEKKLAALGGNPLTFEENLLFQQIMRQGAGVNHVDHRVGMPIFNLFDEAIAPKMEMPIGECEELTFAVILGLDITEEFPVVWLRLRQAINRGATVLFLGHYAPEVSQFFTKTHLHAPGNELEMIKQHLPEITALAANGKKGALFVGKQYLSTVHRRDILSELIKLRYNTPTLSLNIMEGRGNSMGARLAGMHPALGPLGKRLSQPGFDAIQILEQSMKSGWDFLYVAGANPATKYPSKLWSKARSNLKFLVVQDLFLTETAMQADVVLPTLSFVEKSGSFINISGRVQLLQPGKFIPENILSDAEIFNILAQKLNINDFGPHNVGTGNQDTDDAWQTSEINHELAEVRGHSLELAATFAYSLFDHGERMQRNSHLVQLAKEPNVRIHPMEGKKRGINDGDMAQIKANDKCITGIIALDTNVSEGTVVLPLGFAKIPVQELGNNLLNGLKVEISK